VFSQSPVRFQTDNSGINVTRKNDKEVEITITADSPLNEATGLKFALDISKNGTTTTLLSPDPILINATIGDG
jgi:hypothetical protein